MKPSLGQTYLESTDVAQDASVSVFQKLEQFYQDMRTGRLDAAMTLYTADAEVILPGQASVTGTNAIRSWWASTLNEFEFGVSPELVESVDLGNGVVLRGRVSGKLISRKGGTSIDIDSWFMQIYRRQSDGTYLFWRGASGSNPVK
jgi:ketosteroid isomerase-like protein